MVVSLSATRKYFEKNFEIYEISVSVLDDDQVVNGCEIDSDTFADLISNKIDNAKNANARNLAYAVGDFLRLPKLYEAEDFDAERLTNETMRMRSGNLYPESIVHKYYESAALSNGDNEARIIPEILRDTVEKYIDALINKTKLRGIFLDEDVVLVHLRIGDIGHVDEFILSRLKILKLRHPKFIVVAGVHSAWMHSSIAWGMEESLAKLRAYENARIAFKQLYQTIGSFDWLVCDPDLVMCAAYLSRKLFVHRGGFSATLGLLATGKIYATNKLEHFQKWETKKWSTWEQSLSNNSCLEIL